jgi:hypothetical protein
MTTTPALTRATEALNYVFDEEPRTALADLDEPTRLLLAEGARAAVSAALHDPDDPDFGARNLYETEHAAWLRSEDAPNWQWEILPEAERDVYRARYTNLVVAILGEAS